MEQLNKVELIGVVGTIKVQTVQGTQMAKMQMATNYAYKNEEGEPVIETTWHNVTAWEGRNMPDFSEIQRGTNLKVIGRLRYQRYTTPEGHEVAHTDVVAHKIEIV